MVVITEGYLLGKNRTRKLLDYGTCSLYLYWDDDKSMYIKKPTDILKVHT